MANINFFKQKAKKLFDDYKTRYFNEDEGYYDYKPRFFNDIFDILSNFHITDDMEFGLMKAQHIIAKLSGFNKWTDLIKASEPALEIGKLLLTNREKYQEEQCFFTNMVESMIVTDWKSYEEENLRDFNDEEKLEIFKRVFLNEGNSNKRFISPKIVIDFTNDDNSQDMIMKVMKEKNLTPEKAILSCITQKNCLTIIETGWGEIALSIWGHDDPYREKEKLSNPKVEFKLSKSKERLVSLIMGKENVDLPTAILYFVLFNLESMGYHI